MEITMTQDKVTKNSVRFTSGRLSENDSHTKNIYLLKDEVAALGNPASIKVTIEPIAA